jgi:hypothetical protein
VQVVAPSTGDTNPARQSIHSVAPLELYLPTGHSEHVEDECEEYEPASHTVHETEPVSLLVLEPLPHVKHSSDNGCGA